VSFCRGLAAVLARVMRDPPITPYAVAGFTHDADLDCAQATADFGYAPRGVRAGLAACISAAVDAASSTTPTEIRRAT
jgi:hypothetical protein